MEYRFREIEKKWQEKWAAEQVYRTEIDPSKPKYYVLDMFPYPSGAGLHVGHPLGYIASDIVSRYKRLKGFNVLHPMGFDAFGLPAEQYAIQTGRHPADTTAENIARYKEQLSSIGFCYDWNREVNTSDPSYYRWTQWIFLQLFGSWFNRDTNKAERIESLTEKFDMGGSAAANAACDEHEPFSAEAWKLMTEPEQRAILMKYRLAYQDYSTVNWCEALGTVLANDEVKDGFSERGGFPVEKRKMRQWFLRITAYAERLIQDLDNLEWSDSMKEMQRNWIGRSEGASVHFKIEDSEHSIEVFSTRPDTIFGVDFLTLAPEHELVPIITTADRKNAVEEYVTVARNRSERERQAEVKKISGEFTGAYAIHPFSGKQIPIWVGDYVLAGYGTGAVMAVPAGDQRDWDFARHFSISISPIHEDSDLTEGANPSKDAKLINSDFLNGLSGYEAIPKAIAEIEKGGFGRGRVNYRLRDAGFSRQRYWGEPFPIVYKDDIPYALDENELPLELPKMDDFRPTGQPEGPLAKATNWVNSPKGKRETDTMPGYAGSSWYFLRYMDPNNSERFVGKEAESYWKDVDLYIGGTEHAVGHLMYARFWQKFLYDLGLVCSTEPFKRLVNQGMILGMSAKAKLIQAESGLRELSDIDSPDDTGKQLINFPVEFCQLKNVSGKDRYLISAESFAEAKLKYPYLNNIHWPAQKSEIVLLAEVEKMSKSKYNVVNPDDIIAEYGADTLRLYEMFLGPLEQPKPWNTNGIEGVFRFLNKVWKLVFGEDGNVQLQDGVPTEAELRVLHKTIKKLEEDIERFSFNTSVSNFMICVNELNEIKCRNKSIIRDFLILMSPFAPHICEELWQAVKNDSDPASILLAEFPKLNEDYLQVKEHTYPVAFNGKVRYQIQVSADADVRQVQEVALSHDEAERWLNGSAPRKVIVVPGRMVNVVV